MNSISNNLTEQTSTPFSSTCTGKATCNSTFLADIEYVLTIYPSPFRPVMRDSVMSQAQQKLRDMIVCLRYRLPCNEYEIHTRTKIIDLFSDMSAIYWNCVLHVSTLH
jgi:hypothetical protein